MRKSIVHVSKDRDDGTRSGLTGKGRINLFESLIDLLPNLGAGKNNFAADKDEEDNFGLDHAVDEARKQLWLVGAEVMMSTCKTFQPDRELDVARANNVLNLEVGEFGVEA